MSTSDLLKKYTWLRLTTKPNRASVIQGEFKGYYCYYEGDNLQADLIEDKIKMICE